MEEQNLDLFMETSAKTGYYAKDILDEAAKLLYMEICILEKKKENKKNENNIKADNNISKVDINHDNKNENICLIEFNYEGKSVEIQCNLKDKMKDNLLNLKIKQN